MQPKMGAAPSINDWRRCLVGEIVAPVRNALVGGPFGSNLVSKDYRDEGVPVIRGQNMGSGRWIDGEFAFVSDEKAAALSANIARPMDVVFTQRGTLGQVALVPSEPFSEYLVSQSQMKLTVDPQKADSAFIYYLFSAEEMRDYIRANAIQTGVPHTNLGLLRTTPLILPPLPEQRAIAHILGTLDDKIELNRRMNQTLEEMARALFHSWFVVFDPVRAKAAGRQPAGMDAATAALFPDALEETEQGEIPAGWKWSTIGDEFDVTMGQSPPGATYNEEGEGLPFYQGRSDFGFRFPDLRVYCTAPTRFAQRGDALISVRAPVGDLNIALDNCAIGRGVAALRHKSKSPSITFYMLQQVSTQLEGFNAEGTVFGSINQSALKQLQILAPPDAALEAFTRSAEPVDSLIESNERELITLKNIRDTLLPKLLSGEMRVGEAEEAVAAETGVTG